MSKQTVIDSGAAGGAIAMALLDLLIAKGTISKEEGVTLLGAVQKSIGAIHGSDGTGAALIVGRMYGTLTKSR